MKSVPKLIRRFAGIFFISTILLIFLNITILIVITYRQTANVVPWQMAKEAAGNLQRRGNEYELPEDIEAELRDSGAWGIFIDNDTMQVVWQTENLPDTIPRTYTLSGIASLTRGYIDGYPTFTGEAEEGLLVLGYPQNSYWKHMWPSWDYYFIAKLPRNVLLIFAINVVVIFLIYVTANFRMLKSIGPITDGIQALPTGEPVCVPERGLLSELALNINQTSQMLQSQSRLLRRRETARANWIAGVSHDIRTPLAMVMGYAGQLASDAGLDNGQREKAAVILRQSEKMRNLINDLNLASKLEYNMQPIHSARENLVSIARQVVVDFMNTDIDARHPIQWETEETLADCPVYGDQELLKRAITNLIQNSINHNEQGCGIYVRVMMEKACDIDRGGVGARQGSICVDGICGESMRDEDDIYGKNMGGNDRCEDRIWGKSMGGNDRYEESTWGKSMGGNDRCEDRVWGKSMGSNDRCEDRICGDSMRRDSRCEDRISGDNIRGEDTYREDIYVNDICCIEIDDDGIGATALQIEKLNNAPHYMVCDENTMEQRHGLGLLIVKQIVASHGGTVTIGQSRYGGFRVKIALPVYDEFQGTTG